MKDKRAMKFPEGVLVVQSRYHGETVQLMWGRA
jgi:hypothetical protein